MVTEEVMEILGKIYDDLEKFINLVGLEYDLDEDEYICHNEDQVDEEWCDRDMLSSIDCAYSDIGFFLGR